MRLGGLVADPQAQLDGFRSRALRVAEAPVQRHLYVTEWRAVVALVAERTAALVTGAEEAAVVEWDGPLAAGLPAQPLRRGQRPETLAAAQSVATRRGARALAPLAALEAALALAQTLGMGKIIKSQAAAT